MAKRIRIEFRLSEEELMTIKNNAKDFKSVSLYIKRAIEEFSNKNIQDRIKLGEELSRYYIETNKHLSHIGGNLNQALRHCNELAKSGIDIKEYFGIDVIKQIEECYKISNLLNSKLDILTDKLLI